MNSPITSTLEQLPFSHWQPVIIGAPVIESFDTGLSHQVFKVSFATIERGEQKITPLFVAKHVANRETRHAEFDALQRAFQCGVSVKPIYVDDNWLITEYFNGDCLESLDLDIEQKLEIALSLVAKFHQSVKHGATSINLQQVIDKLISKSGLSPKHQQLLSTVTVEHLLPQPDCGNLVHGDVNFTNVLVNQADNTAKLIDFEAASYASMEYELGMMMSVNFIHPDTFFRVLKQSSYLCALCPKKVTRNAIMSSIINVLWYFTHDHENGTQVFKNTAFAQLEHLDLLTNEKYLLIKEMR
ncbi:phosphotransferase [Thalassotalea atypica]|uniref:phosphotransferase n=1 Tax=Thalassotalea atypica TaxID=2054316 RepID=UPI0025742C92|nr:phosphotransferase [Thalassotalea atypica]